MFSCDYNGWADVPEEEREGIETFEAAQSAAETSTLVLVFERSLISAQENGERWAA